MNKRIWELDAFRGICILGMVIVHFIYDLTDLYGIIRWDAPALFSFVQNWGGLLFLLLSGICATLGSRSVRRGIIVFACGMIRTAVTAGMYLLNMADKYIIIYFGVLHCLGLCMILWAAFKKLPAWCMGLLGVAMVILGFWFQTFRVEATWLFPLGLLNRGFASSDYFPLFPNLGYFLVGAALGKHFYCEKVTRFPGVNANRPVICFFRFCGRHSLLIYLLHQPLLAIGCELFVLLKGL